MLKKLALCCLLLPVILVLTGCSTTSIFSEGFGDKVSFYTTQSGEVHLEALHMEGYEELLDRFDVHITFIPYEKVKMLGDLLKISVGGNLKWNGNRVTQIELDGNGYYLFAGEQGTILYIGGPADEIIEEEFPVVTDIPNKHDLRNFSPGKQCTYRVGSIIYYYYNELETITWRSKYHVYTISLDYGVQYDNEFLLRLFDEDTAEGAINEFNESIEQMVFWRKMHRVVGHCLIALAIVATPILSYLLIRRKRKRKAAAAVVSLEEPPIEGGQGDGSPVS